MSLFVPSSRLVGRWCAGLLIAAFCLVFAFFLSLGAWMFAGVLFLVVAALVMLIVGFERLAIVWIIGIPSVFTYINNVASVLPSFTVGRLLFVILLGILIAGTAVGVRKADRLNRVETAALLFLGLMLLSMIVGWLTVTASGWRTDGALWLTGYCMPLGAYAIARRISWTDRKVRLLMTAILVNAGFLMIVALSQYLFDFRGFNATYMETQHADESYVRGIGTFGSSWELGAVSAVFVLIGVYLLSTAMGALNRLMLFGLTGAAVVSLLISLTRAPMLALIVGVGVTALLDRSVRRLALPLGVAGFFAGLLGLPLLLASPDVMGRLTELSPIYNRLALYVTSINMGLHNMFLGIGFGSRAFAQAAPDYMVSFGPVQANWMLGVAVPHHEFLHVWVTCGMPALILFVLIFLGIGRQQWRSAVNPEMTGFTRQFAALALGALVIELVVMNTLDIAFGRYFSVLVFFIAGISAALAERDQRRLISIAST